MFFTGSSFDTAGIQVCCLLLIIFLFFFHIHFHSQFFIRVSNYISSLFHKWENELNLKNREMFYDAFMRNSLQRKYSKFCKDNKVSTEDKHFMESFFRRKSESITKTMYLSQFIFFLSFSLLL